MRKNRHGRVSRELQELKAWEETASQQEKELKAKAIEYDRLYFDDFNFESGSITGSIFDNIPPCPITGIKRGKLYELTNAVINDCRFHIKEFYKGSDVAGNCDGWNITICPSCADRADVIVHEMIHLRIKAMPDHFKEILTVCLYKKLKKEIKAFEKIIIKHATAVAADRPNLWHHGTLFFLKSLDLDMRLNLDFGTVYGYEW